MIYKFIEVEADNLEKAIDKVRENPDDYDLPDLYDMDGIFKRED